MYNYASVQARSRRKDCVHPNIRKEAVLWYHPAPTCSHTLINDTNRGCRLINHAFHHILSLKAHSYRSLLVYLDFEIGRKHRYHRKFNSLVREGLATFTQFVITSTSS
jgi:hypothetical protein